MLLIHITIALLSLVVITYGYIFPSSKSIIAAKVLAAGTLSTGVVLVISAPAHLLAACLSGITYFTIASFAIVLTQKRFTSLVSK